MSPSSLPETDNQMSLTVDSVETDGVRVSVRNMDGHSSLEPGQELSVHVVDWYRNVGKTTVEGIPIRVEGGRPLREIPIRIEIIEFTKGYVRAEFIRADVSVRKTEDFDELIQSGDTLLQEKEYVDAAMVFATAVELIPQTDNPKYMRARIREIFAICESLCQQDKPMSGADFIKVVKQEIEGADGTFGTQLKSYRYILEAATQISDSESAEDKVTATACRRDARQNLEEAVGHLDELENANVDSPHPIIITAIKRATDKLLLTPDSVSQYMGSS